MLKNTLIAVSLGILAFGVGRPAAAQTTFLNEYGLLSGGRVAQGVKDSVVPRNALQGQRLEEEPKNTFVFSGGFSRQDLGVGDTMTWGGGIGLIGVQNPDHPWQLTASAFNTNLDSGGIDDDFFGWSVGGKYTISLPKNADLPAISAVATYSDVNSLGETLFLGAAADQRITPSLYLTGNLGWLHAENGGFNENGMFAGIGATFTSGRWPRLSLSGDFLFENDVTREDLWTIAALYAVNDNVAVRVGGGKHDLIFANVYVKRGK
jgi:hypothetical protein